VKVQVGVVRCICVRVHPYTGCFQHCLHCVGACALDSHRRGLVAALPDHCFAQWTTSAAFAYLCYR
jgi:hypothetical protein